MYQNYPNPFNSNTVIHFELPKEAQVSLIVYDLLGQEVNELVSEKREAGSYDVQFDGSMLTSGIYFYRLQTEDYNNTRKLLLLK